MADLLQVRSIKHYKPRSSPLPGDFKNLYRFEQENVQWLANRFLGNSDETRGGALSSTQRMKVCLRYLADPGYQKGVGEELGVEQSTVSRTVKHVVNCINQQANDWIKFPTSPNEILQAKRLWQSKYTFPTAIGVIDCTHIGIKKPSIHGDEYINRKGKATLNVQATCNAKEMFTSLDVSWPGSVHDSRIWKNSEIRRNLIPTEDAVLLADSGYGIEPWLMTPYENPNNEDEMKYNKLFKKERVVIERCFGQLKMRFPILLHVCRAKLENIPKIVIACAVLHNVAKVLHDQDFEPQQGREANERGNVLENIVENERVLRQRGQEIRQNLAGIINHYNL